MGTSFPLFHRVLTLAIARLNARINLVLTTSILMTFVLFAPPGHFHPYFNRLFISGFPDRVHFWLHPEAGVQVRVRGEGGDEGLRHVYPLKVAGEELDSKGTGRKNVFFLLRRTEWWWFKSLGPDCEMYEKQTRWTSREMGLAASWIIYAITERQLSWGLTFRNHFKPAKCNSDKSA